MFSPKAFLSLILVNLAVADSGPVSRSTGKATLSFSQKIIENDKVSIAEKDRARAQALKNAVCERSSSFNVTNAVVTYTAQVGVGSLATDCMYIIHYSRQMG